MFKPVAKLHKQLAQAVESQKPEVDDKKKKKKKKNADPDDIPRSSSEDLVQELVAGLIQAMSEVGGMGQVRTQIHQGLQRAGHGSGSLIMCLAMVLASPQGGQDAALATDALMAEMENCRHLELVSDEEFNALLTRSSALVAAHVDKEFFLPKGLVMGAVEGNLAEKMAVLVGSVPHALEQMAGKVDASMVKDLQHTVTAEQSLQSTCGFNKDKSCLLYTSDAADEEDSVDLGGRRIIKKKKKDQWGGVRSTICANALDHIITAKRT
eukprot:TRINITY_DN2708_c0_g1_i5.p1 TRINITY_DN2708_c0_g1~~TRINITY_DN2708_c0_g1_i5.p1  ORF type:complete len:267 (-),score=92.73 TRINITY_DN2708_c0_g1_i5:17-817(-)